MSYFGVPSLKLNDFEIGQTRPLAFWLGLGLSKLTTPLQQAQIPLRVPCSAMNEKIEPRCPSSANQLSQCLAHSHTGTHGTPPRSPDAPNPTPFRLPHRPASHSPCIFLGSAAWDNLDRRTEYSLGCGDPHPERQKSRKLGSTKCPTPGCAESFNHRWICSLVGCVCVDGGGGRRRRAARGVP